MEGEWAGGVEGGGIAIALGILGLGATTILVFEGVRFSDPSPTFDVRPPLGVPKGELVERAGDGRWFGACFGEGRLERVGLVAEDALRVGLVEPEARELSWVAVIPAYLDARDPGVKFVSLGIVLVGVLVGP